MGRNMDREVVVIVVQVVIVIVKAGESGLKYLFRGLFMILQNFRPAPKPPIEIRAPDELLLGPSNCNMKTQWRHSAATLVSSSVKYEVFVSFNESFSYLKIFFQNSI